MASKACACVTSSKVSVALAEDQSSDLSTYGEWLTNATTPAPGNLLHSLNLLGHQIDSPHTLFFEER